jgi:hypothetical protein
MRSPSCEPTTSAASCETHRSHARDIDRVDDVRPGHIGLFAHGLRRANLEPRRLVLGAHQIEGDLAPEVARPDLGDPIRVGVLERPLRERGHEPLQAVRKFAHDGVRERHRTLEARGPYKLDAVVADRMVGLVGECELVGAEP